MPRYRLTLEYDGGPFVGWQRQDNGASVQGALEEAVFRFCGERVTAAAAGRTDAGVHALAMTAHIDLEDPRDPFVIGEALNYHLKPSPVAVLSVDEAGEGFHARFSAVGRRYVYRIVNRRAPLALDQGRAWRVAAPLDADAMHQGAQFLVGRHDFSTFRAAQCQAASPVKSLSEISCERAGDEIRIRVAAPSFLHHQVRSIAGSLVEVGAGKWAPGDIDRILKRADRAACGPVAPASGLYFVRADYPAPD